MSRRDRGRVADHLSTTSYASGEADQGHEVRHAAGRRHRLQVQRLQAGRVTPCTPQTSRSAEGAATRPPPKTYGVMFMPMAPGSGRLAGSA